MADKSIETATLAGGCFWCLEAVFLQVSGIENVVSGYCGGHIQNPSYQQVCSETTGHAEAVQITFNPSVIPYTKLLDIFFAIHDPTTLNRQGYDIGSSYRSAIFYHTKEQQNTASNKKTNLEAAHVWDDPIVTEINPMSKFYPAEDYHQKYYLNNENQQYCQVVISPKLAKFRKEHMKLLKPLVSI